MATNTITLGGQTYAINSETPYIDAYNAYKANQDKIYQQQQEALKSQNTADTNKLNSQYDSTARQAYVQNMQSKNALPEQLKAQGVTGGASETALINLANNYGKNIANNESARGTALGDLAQAYANNLSTLSTNYQNTISTAEKEALANQAQYTDTLNQRKLEQYSATIGRFNSVSACNNEIAALNASSDPLKAEKIMLVQAQRAVLQAKAASSSSGSGYYYSSGSSGSSGSSSGTKSSGGSGKISTKGSTTHKSTSGTKHGGGGGSFTLKTNIGYR